MEKHLTKRQHWNPRMHLRHFAINGPFLKLLFIIIILYDNSCQLLECVILI